MGQITSPRSHHASRPRVGQASAIKEATKKGTKRVKTELTDSDLEDGRQAREWRKKIEDDQMSHNEWALWASRSKCDPSREK